MIKLMIIEELAAMRKHLRTLLSRQLNGQSLQVYEAQEAKQAVTLLQVFQPTHVIMNTSIPGMHALQLARKIWEQSPGTRIMFWVRQRNDYLMAELLRSVPRQSYYAYVLQSSTDETLWAATDALLRNQNYIDSALKLPAMVPSWRHNVVTDAEYITLGDVVLGLTDKAISSKRALSVRGVQHRIACVADKLLGARKADLTRDETHNLRARLVMEAFRQGLFSVDDICTLEKEHHIWLRQQQSQLTVQPLDSRQLSHIQTPPTMPTLRIADSRQAL